MAVSKKITNGVIVFSALLSIYVTIKDSPELISLIAGTGKAVKGVFE